ncbi:hypothetical protein [Streptomyces sp. NPDC059063]|uniref:hypothetical protein n=1 Tax=unclassified Streptomyces TaxID=2593676 RepID=UPI0036BE8B29
MIAPATANYLEVLDGRTLNVHATFPGALMTAARQPSVELSLCQGDVDHRGVLSVEAGSGGTVTVSGLVPLEGPVPFLSSGRWSLGLVVSGRTLLRARSVTRVRLAPPARRALPDGPTTSVPASTVTGRRYVPGAVDGLCVLDVRDASPRADVTRVRLGFTSLDVEGRLIGAGRRPGAVLRARLVPRTGKARLDDVPVPHDGTSFRFRFPLDAVAAAMGPVGEGCGEWIWDSHLLLPGADRPLRIGRMLTDATSPRAVYEGREQLVRTPAGALLRVRHYTTPAGSLAVACAVLRGGRGTASTPSGAPA